LWRTTTENGDGFEVLQSVEAPNLEVAIVHLMNRELERGTITKQYEGAKYAQWQGEKTLWVVFPEGQVPSLHRLKGAF
jgi:hypothetical protein